MYLGCKSKNRTRDLSPRNFRWRISEAEMILVMNKGSIIEMGNHIELLAQNGFYADLYNSQFASLSLENEVV
jgi:hypothetical protein